MSHRDPSTHRDDVIRLRLAAQAALLGEITPHLFAVTVAVSPDRAVNLAAYYDGEVGEQELEDMRSVALEITAYMGSVERDGKLIEANGGYATVHNMHVESPTMLDVWVFRRAGS